MILRPKPGELTQGTLFSCAIAEEYPGLDVSGLIITARCDAANDKTDVYNYLPVVKFSDWICRDGARVLAARTQRAMVGEMRNVLIASGEAPSLLDHLEPSDILETLFSNSSDKKVLARASQFEKLRTRLECAISVASGNIDSLVTIFDAERKEAERISRELVGNGLAEYYFLPALEPSGSDDGYVVLLREIRHFPRSLALLVRDGLDLERYDVFCRSRPDRSRDLAIKSDQIAWPLGVVQSPEIEHLMQRFTHLFARIGVAETPRESLAKLERQFPKKQEV